MVKADIIHPHYAGISDIIRLNIIFAKCIFVCRKIRHYCKVGGELVFSIIENYHLSKT